MPVDTEVQTVRRFSKVEAASIPILFVTMHRMHSMTTTRRIQFLPAAILEEQLLSSMWIQVSNDFRAYNNQILDSKTSDLISWQSNLLSVRPHRYFDMPLFLDEVNDLPKPISFLQKL